MSTRDLIDNIKKGDAMKSNNTFNSIGYFKFVIFYNSYNGKSEKRKFN